MFFDFSNYGLLKISGNDATKLLQGQFTCDVEKLNSGDITFGAQCNPQGRIISLFYLQKINDGYQLILPQSMLAITQKALKKYSIFYKVILSEITDLTLVIYEGDVLPEGLNGYILFDKYHLILLSPIERDIIKNILSTTKWQEKLIELGIPVILPETSEKFLPHDINLPNLNAINFEKGCYTGQEIIARMHYKGKLKNKLCRASIKSNSTPRPGDEIFYRLNNESKYSGMIVNSVMTEANHYQMLIMVDIQNALENHLYLINDSNAFFTFKDQARDS